MNKIKYILFDMDGVLIDAKEWHYEALNRALQIFGMSISRYDHLHTFDGLPTSKKLDMLSKEKNLPASLHPFINRLKQQFTIEAVQKYCKPIFQHQFALSQLTRDGYKIAVCSNSIRMTIELMMEKAALMPYLSFFLSNQDILKPKPHPEIYLTAMQRFNASPAETLVIEDNPHGLEAARASEAHVMQVDHVFDVNHRNIMAKIAQIENLNKLERGRNA